MTSVKSKKGLPFEVLSQIFEHLSFTDKLVCQTVCKTWSRAALLCANKSVKVHGFSGIQRLVSDLTKNTDNNNCNMEYSGALVKRIRILDSKDVDYLTYAKKEVEDFVVQLLQACPNLEKIMLRTRDICYYLEWMDKNSSAIVLDYLKCIDIGGTNRKFSQLQLSNDLYHLQLNTVEEWKISKFIIYRELWSINLEEEGGNNLLWAMIEEELLYPIILVNSHC